VSQATTNRKGGLDMRRFDCLVAYCRSDAPYGTVLEQDRVVLEARDPDGLQDAAQAWVGSEYSAWIDDYEEITG
jgi:hypothetical protein